MNSRNGLIHDCQIREYHHQIPLENEHHTSLSGNLVYCILNVFFCTKDFIPVTGRVCLFGFSDETILYGKLAHTSKSNAYIGNRKTKCAREFPSDINLCLDSTVPTSDQCSTFIDCIGFRVLVT